MLFMVLLELAVFGMYNGPTVNLVINPSEDGVMKKFRQSFDHGPHSTISNEETFSSKQKHPLQNY